VSTVLITGGHTGIGLQAATTIASEFRLNLVLAGRDLARVDAAAAALRKRYGVRVATLSLNLSSLDSVSAAAAASRAMIKSGEIDSLQAILCNAGAQFHGPVSYSADGYEETFAVNCLGHFLLLNLLMDCVSEKGRIVFTASGTHDPATMDGKMVGAAVEPDATSLANEGKDGVAVISGGKRYTTSKLCMILYAYELDRRLRRAGSSVQSIAFDPGFIPETGLTRTASGPVQWISRTPLMKRLVASLGVTMGSLEFSGSALARIAADPAFAAASGKYLQSKDGSLREARSSSMSYDEARAAKLWVDSQRLVHFTASEESVRFG